MYASPPSEFLAWQPFFCLWRSPQGHKARRKQIDLVVTRMLDRGTVALISDHEFAFSPPLSSKFLATGNHFSAGGTFSPPQGHKSRRKQSDLVSCTATY
jgi:hypothetical protein